MKKSDIRLLVVEDDPTLGKAIQEALKRDGYNAQLDSSYVKAKQSMKLNDYHGFVIDCMLPQKSGVDLAQELITEPNYKNTPIVFVSGIFKDRSFSLDLQKKVPYKAFLYKPFDLNDLLKAFDEHFKEKLGGNHLPVYQLLAQEQIATSDRVQAINSTKYLHGFDLPYIFSLLINTSITGDLNIKYSDGREARLDIYKGKISGFQYQDTESFFGVLLIEMGFLTPEELQVSLDDGQKIPIGQKLVENSTVSPHSIQIVHHQQMIIRLSKGIQDTSIEVEFVEKEKPEPVSFVDGLEYTRLLHDWIQSKLPPDWLRSFYTPWLDHPVIRGADFAKSAMLKSFPSARQFFQTVGDNFSPQKLEEILANPNVNEEEFLKGLHFLMTERVLNFANHKEETQNLGMKMDRLRRIWAEMKNQDHFAALGVSRSARPTEIHRAYHELAKSLHPDRLPSKATAEMREFAQNIFAKISEAHNVLNDDKKREHYKKTLEIGLAEEILKAESIFEEGYRLLQANHFRDARKTFERVVKLKGHRSDTMVYLIWAFMKEKRNRAEHAEIIEYVSGLFAQIPHEDRHSPHYFFIKGMAYEMSGQLQKSVISFKHCIAMDPNFIDARRELAFIKQNYGSTSKGTFSDDLSHVVTKFFKGGKRSG